MFLSKVHRLFNRIILPIFKSQTACIYKNYISCLPDLSEIENGDFEIANITFSAFSSDTDNMTDGCTNNENGKQILNNIENVISLLQKLVA